MSKKELLASSLGQLADLCFTISGLVIDDESSSSASTSAKKVAGPSASKLSPTAAVFKPSGKGTTAGNQGSKCAVSEDWDSVPDLVSVGSEILPTYRQVAGGPQTVLVTPVRSGSRAKSVGSVSSKVVMALPFTTVAEFEAIWQSLASEQERMNAETAALQQGNDALKIAALLKRDQRNASVLAAVTAQLAQSQQASGVASAKASPPPKFENKGKDVSIRQWLPMIEDYLAATPNNQYLRLASSYLGGKPRSYWVSQYEAYTAANPQQEPDNARQFFRDVMIRGYGIRDPIQSYFDTWNKLRQGPDQSVDEYNVAFEQALVDLGTRITDEDTKIEHYRAGLQSDLREMCRTDPAGERWTTLQALARYATLQWPTIEARLARLKSSQPSSKVDGKRKSSGGSHGRSSKAKLGVALTDEQRDYNMKHRLCHKCGKPGHIARDCDEEVPQNNAGKGKGKAKVAKSREDF